MAAVWTSTVPRRPVSIDPAADGVAVASASGPVVTYATRTPDIAEQDIEVATPAVTTASIAASYVEIARFNTRGDADAARAQLLSQGMPTALGGIERGNGAMTFVLLSGPFTAQTDLDGSLSRARSLGYSGATIR